MKKRKLVLKKDVVSALTQNQFRGGYKETLVSCMKCEDPTIYSNCTCFDETVQSKCICGGIGTVYGIDCNSVMPPVPETYGSNCAILTPSDNGRVSCDTECFCNGD